MNLDTEIILELKKGSIRAFEVLYYKYSKGLISFAVSFIHDRAMSEDIVQESFFALWQQRNNLDEDQSIRNFLFGIVKNKSLEYLRKKGGNTMLSFDEMTADDFFISRKLLSLQKTDSCETDIEHLRLEIEQTYNSLPDIYKEVFRMSRYEYKSNKEIAEQLNISVKAVEKRMTHTLKTFKDKLGHNYVLFIILIS